MSHGQITQHAANIGVVDTMQEINMKSLNNHKTTGIVKS